jgi:hypothetical protein
VPAPPAPVESPLEPPRPPDVAPPANTSAPGGTARLGPMIAEPAPSPGQQDTRKSSLGHADGGSSATRRAPVVARAKTSADLAADMAHALCPSPGTLCSGECVNLITDAAHCGACGRQCSSGDHCVLGECKPRCVAGLVYCGGYCADLMSDPRHCGACEAACMGITVTVTRGRLVERPVTKCVKGHCL